jgi:transposase
MGAQRRQFTSEFKLEAVRLVTEEGRAVNQVARELGIRPNQLRAWKQQAQGRAGLAPSDVFPGAGNLTSAEEEIRRLRRQLDVVTQERDFLKKAAAYFARESR